MRIAIVMPPATELPPEAALDLWSTVVQQARALRDHRGVEVVVACRTLAADAAITERGGTLYHFAATDRGLVADVRRWKPDVVHVHGLGFTRLTLRLARALRGRAAIVLQHHGEPPDDRLHVLAHRLVRRHVAGYLFTGASTGQAKPFVDRGQIDASARLFDVIEAASTLPEHSPVVELDGDPAILWVGRLIQSKDPLAAIAAFALVAGDALPNATLQLIATDRCLEKPVRQAVAALGALGERVHLHDPVAPVAMRGWYAAADVFLSTSWREGSGYALIEAITEGCAPVATSIPSHRSIVADLAPTFPPGDVSAAARLIIAATTMDRSEIRSSAASRLSWPAVAGQLVDAYATVRRPAPG